MTGKLSDRPLPSLAEWLGDGTRCQGFEEWVREAIFIEHAVTDPAEAATVRMLKTLSVAITEACRIEQERHGGKAADISLRMARVCGVAVMGAVISVLDDERRAPLLRIARALAIDFEHGAKTMARASTRRSEGLVP